MKTKLEVKYGGKNKMFLHQEVGKGTMPDDRKCRLIQTNAGIHLQVYDKDDKGWKTFSVSWMDLTKAIGDVVVKLEAE